VAESEQAMAAQAYERHPGAASGPLPSSYRRREPERSILYETVRTHWNTLLAEVAQRTDGGSLPGFVVAEFERYLSCGILANGFARVHCDACGKDVQDLIRKLREKGAKRGFGYQTMLKFIVHEHVDEY